MNVKSKTSASFAQQAAAEARLAEEKLFNSGNEAEANVKSAKEALTRAEALEELILLSERGEIRQSQVALKKCTLKDLNRIK
jgi:hypothetical protein